MRRALIFIAVLLLVVAAVDIWLYASTFRAAGLSPNPEHWGQFGDYVGGTLNPLLSFGAFVGVLFTIYLQDKQLHHTRRQETLGELQRLMSSASQDIDRQLQQRLSRAQVPVPGGELPTLWLVISALGTAALRNDSRLEPLRARALPDSLLEIQTFLIDLKQLVWLLTEYEREGGAQSVVAFYRKRYEVVVCWLHVVGLLEGHVAVSSYFTPEKLIPYLTEEKHGA